MRVMEDSFDPAYGEAWTAPQCAGLMPMPGVWLSLARDGEEVIGFALGRLIADEAELLLLAVKRSCQRRGAGAMLLNRFISIANNAARPFSS
jgi:ribosomal-protein-alanine N-acetyltransferase